MPANCILGCGNIEDVAIHLFPNPSKDPKRFKQWVDIVGGLQGKTELEFYKRRKICDIHFTDQCRNRFNRLNAIAVPTLHLQGETDPLDEYRIRRSKAETTIEEEYLEDDFLYDQDVQEVVSDWDESDDFQKSETVVQEPNNQVHEGFQCNVCQKDIIGFRYACVQCSDWDMCGGCEARGEHAGHYVLRVPGPKPYSEIQTILKCIRNELFPEPGHEKSIVDCEVKSENESDSDTDISKPEATEKINTIKKQTIAKAPICSKTKNNISTPINNSPNVRVYSRNTDISEPQATEKIKTTEKPTIAKVPICSKTKNNTPINKSPNFKVYSSITKVHSAPEHPPKTDINARSRIQMRPPETIKIRPPETKKKITHLKLRVPPEIKLDTLQKALRRDVVVKIKRLEQRVDYEELIKKLKISNYSNFNTNFDKHKHSNIINPTLLEP